MVSRVLVAMDGSEMSEEALRHALDAYTDAEITVLSVVGEPSAMFGQAMALALSENIGESAEQYAQPVLDRAHEIAEEFDREISTDVKIGHPARAIIRTAGEFDTVVLGSHGGRLAGRLFVGNVAEQVFRRSPVPVVVVR